MSRRLIPSNDWWRAQLTLLLLNSLVHSQPTSLPIVISFLFTICFHLFFLFIPIQPSPGANSIPMLILVCLAATLCLFHTLAESVISPPTMQNTVFAKRMCQLSLAQQPTLANPAVKLLSWSSTRACGLVPGSHTHSLIKTNSNTTMASPYRTTPSNEINPFPLNIPTLLSHSRLLELLSF